jgi:hypothetical protein
MFYTDNTCSPPTSCIDPRGYVSSPLLFSFYTNDRAPNVFHRYIITFSDGTALVALIKEGVEPGRYLASVIKVLQWWTMMLSFSQSPHNRGDYLRSRSMQTVLFPLQFTINP